MSSAPPRRLELLLKALELVCKSLLYAASETAAEARGVSVLGAAVESASAEALSTGPSSLYGNYDITCIEASLSSNVMSFSSGVAVGPPGIALAISSSSSSNVLVGASLPRLSSWIIVEL